jgi:cob(I)alamin adenosyltransferase
MAKFTRIYTRTGDDGSTGLVGGQRIAKDARRIEAFGTLDELSSSIGIVRVYLADSGSPVARRLDAWLHWTQDVLFNVGSDLATLPADRRDSMPVLKEGDIQALERGIDEAQHTLQPLANFIHPGGSHAGSTLHYARTVCRRAERIVVQLSKEETISGLHIHYLNRLSDALFVWARWINHAFGQEETIWQAASPAPQPIDDSLLE